MNHSCAEKSWRRKDLKHKNHEMYWFMFDVIFLNMFVEKRMSLFVAWIFLNSIIFWYNRDRISLY